MTNSTTGLAAHLEPDINWAVTSTFASATVLTSLLASHVGSRRNITQLQRGFAYLVLAIAGFISIDTLPIH